MRLLKSCAMPPASRPTDSSFCACSSAALELLARGDVARDLGDGDDGAVGVAHRREREADLDLAAVAGQADRLVALDRLAPGDAAEHVAHRLDLVGRGDSSIELPDRLVADVAVQARRAAVPGLDPAVGPEPHHAVVGGLDDRRHRAQRLLGAPARGDLGRQLRRALLHAALEVLVQQRAFERRAGLVAEASSVRSSSSSSSCSSGPTSCRMPRTCWPARSSTPRSASGAPREVDRRARDAPAGDLDPRAAHARQLHRAGERLDDHLALGGARLRPSVRR